MKILNEEKKFCPCCMTVHSVQTVENETHHIFKGKSFTSLGVFEYCDIDETFYSTEEQLTQNDVVMKDDYRKLSGLLTSSEIRAIRKKYGVSQRDLCIILGWGGKDVARYETHQVQGRAQDILLRKIDRDSQWFLDLLNGARERLSEKSYNGPLVKTTN